MRLALARRVLGLPPRRNAARLETLWLPCADGVRLATAVAHPEATGGPAPTAVLRTPHPAHAPRHPTLAAALLLAQRGIRTVVQECRGRHDSEGRFTPFEHETRDGGELLAWVAEQPWFDGRLALFGQRYAGFAAWAALAARPEAVQALVVGFATRRPHAGLYRGGALQLAHALHFAAHHSERGEVPARSIDLARGCRFLPVREADRVTLRQVDWFREWLDHPTEDAFWSARTPPLPERLPRTLLVAGWHDPALPAQLADHAELTARAAARGDPAPALCVGPWPAPLRPFAGAGHPLRESFDFLEQTLLAAPPTSEATVRFHVDGEPDLREVDRWPPPQARPLRLQLRSDGHANSLLGDGRLQPEPAAEDEPPDRFRYDPQDPVVSGALGAGARPPDPRLVEARDDVLCYTTPPLAADCVVAGPLRVSLWAASSCEDTDFSARLVQLDGDGVATPRGEGIQRCRWREADAPSWLAPDVPTRLEIDLAATAFRCRAGQRLRLEISSSALPRFDRHGNGRTAPEAVSPGDTLPAAQTVFHDAARPSWLELAVLDGELVLNATGPAGAKPTGPEDPAETVD